MSSMLLKIYSGILITLIVFLSVFLYKKIELQERNVIIQPTYKESIPTAPHPEQLENTSLLQSGVGTTTDTLTDKQIAQHVATTVTAQPITPSQTVTEAKPVVEIDTVTTLDQNYKKKEKPCEAPITYTLGRFDPGFDISKKEFIASMTSATSLWSKGAGKSLFTYSEHGALTINLIFDTRQAATVDNKLIGVEIQNTKDAADALEVKYEALKVTFNTLKDEYATSLESFNTRQKEYGDTVLMWNGKGGAPQYEYDKLNKTRTDLETESKVLTEKREVIVSMLKEINDLITKHNDLIIFANSNVARSNSQPHKKFTEGQYNPNTNTINIYQFTDDIRLYRVLAHEFGHALGVNHNKNPLSIMYYTNTATTTGLSKEDLRDLHLICNN